MPLLKVKSFARIIGMNPIWGHLLEGRHSSSAFHFDQTINCCLMIYFCGQSKVQMLCDCKLFLKSCVKAHSH